MIQIFAISGYGLFIWYSLPGVAYLHNHGTTGNWYGKPLQSNHWPKILVTFRHFLLQKMLLLQC